LSILHNDKAIAETNGPVQASFPSTALPLQRAWVETFRNLGLEIWGEALEGRALGGHISTCHITGEKKERSHAGVAYSEPISERENLRVVTGAMVQRVLFDIMEEEGAVATGVQYVKDGVSRQVGVRREVLLAGGAFATPQLLELSGIGNRTVLEKCDIHVVYPNAAVGENLQDHIRSGLSFEAADGVDPRDPLPLEEARKLYENHRSGPWAEKACWTFAYMPLDPFLSSDEKAELGSLLDRYINDNSLPEFEQKRNRFIREMIESPFEATATAYLSRKPAVSDPSDGDWITLFTMLSHPFSRGSVHITSADVITKPAVDFRYYTHPLDLEIHALHLRALEKLATTELLKSAIRQGGERSPRGHDALTLDAGKELLKGYATTNYHPCGTCCMMPEERGGVVDGRLKVYGTRNVRVVDASVMPVIPRGNIVTTVYAVAERAADLVSEDLGVERVS